jgi:hypothetical protein
MGPDAIPFWEVLDLPAKLRDPVVGGTDTATCMNTATRLVEAGWFAAHGLDEQVDRAALSFHGHRTPRGCPVRRGTLVAARRVIRRHPPWSV